MYLYPRSRKFNITGLQIIEQNIYIKLKIYIAVILYKHNPCTFFNKFLRKEDLYYLMCLNLELDVYLLNTYLIYLENQLSFLTFTNFFCKSRTF